MTENKNIKKDSGTSTGSTAGKKPVTNKRKATTKKKAPVNPEKDQHKETGFLVDAAENIEAGAKIIGKKASSLAAGFIKKTTKATDKLTEKLKDPVSDVLDMGAKAVDEVTATSQFYIKKYKSKIEINRAAKDRDMLLNDLGFVAYTQFKSGRVKPEEIFNFTEIMDIIDAIKEKDIEIIKLGKEIEKKYK